MTIYTKNVQQKIGENVINGVTIYGFPSSGLIIDLKPKYDITIFGMKADISDKMNKRCVTAFNPFDN